jgi:hypothetical protein
VRIIPSSWGSQRTCELHAISHQGTNAMEGLRHPRRHRRIAAAEVRSSDPLSRDVQGTAASSPLTVWSTFLGVWSSRGSQRRPRRRPCRTEAAQGGLLPRPLNPAGRPNSLFPATSTAASSAPTTVDLVRAVFLPLRFVFTNFPLIRSLPWTVGLVMSSGDTQLWQQQPHVLNLFFQVLGPSASASW